MSVPTRKPPLWHLTYSDAICLHSYNVCKDDNFSKYSKWNTVARMLYFHCMRHYFTKMEFSTVRYKILRLSENMRYFHKGGFPMGPLIYVFAPADKAANNVIII